MRDKPQDYLKTYLSGIKELGPKGSIRTLVVAREAKMPFRPSKLLGLLDGYVADRYTLFDKAGFRKFMATKPKVVVLYADAEEKEIIIKRVSDICGEIKQYKGLLVVQLPLEAGQLVRMVAARI